VSDPNATRLTFVVVCLGRTGSTHLGSLLGSHPDIRCFGELFTDRKSTLDDVFIKSPIEDPVEYIDHMTAPLTETAIGFKLPLNSIRAHPEALRLLDKDDLRIVRLRRINLLAVFASRRLLAVTKVSRSTKGDYGDTTVTLDPKKCLAVFGRMEEHERYLDGLAEGKPVFDITYEDLVAGRSLDELQTFLGVEPVTLESRFKRLRSRPLSETIDNWPEVEEALRGSQYERFLEDDLQPR
jgi:hypothetical protein